MDSHEPYPGAQTVSRAVALLKTFTDAQPEWGVSQLARAVGLNRTTTYRLVKALESEGMLARNPATEAYRLGVEVIALGARALRATDLRLASRAELETLAHQSGETATLEVLIAHEVLILDEVQSHHLIGASPSIGTRWPAYATSTGKVLLSELPVARRRELLKPPIAKLTARTLHTQAALRDELARVRLQGYATAFEELQQGYVAIGAPVRDLDGRIVAAISLGGPSLRLTEARVAALAHRVVAAADNVSRNLGYCLDGVVRRRGDGADSE